MWTQHLNDDRSIRAIYGADLPTLDAIYLVEIRIVNGADLDCVLTFDLASLPQILPRKWQEKEINAVSLALNLSSVEITSFHSHGGDLKGNIEIETDGIYKIISFKTNNTLVFQMRAEWIWVSSIQGYLKEMSNE